MLELNSAGSNDALVHGGVAYLFALYWTRQLKVLANIFRILAASSFSLASGHYSAVVLHVPLCHWHVRTSLCAEFGIVDSMPSLAWRIDSYALQESCKWSDQRRSTLESTRCMYLTSAKDCAVIPSLFPDWKTPLSPVLAGGK